MKDKVHFLNQKITHFLEETIWEVDKKYPFWKEVFYYLFRLCYLVLRGITKNKSAIRATALAYETLLAIVPLIAVMLAIFKAFGGLAQIEERLKPFIVSNLAAGTGEVVQKYLLEFTEKIHAGLGVVGFAFLILTVIWLLSTIEAAFNDIWGVQKSRSFLKRFSSYWTIVTIGPIFIAFSVGLTTALQTSPLIQPYLSYSFMRGFLTFLPHLVIWAMFTLVYIYIPNTHVRFRSALIGGILAGTLWELTRYGYTIYATHTETYKSIYGSLGTLPLFLIWLYLSWAIVLIGAEISFADQNIQTYGQEVKTIQISQKFKETLALYLIASIYERYSLGLGSVTSKDLTDQFKLPVRLINEVLFLLSKTGILLETGDEERYYCPAKPIDSMTVKTVLDDLRSWGESPSKFEPVKYAGTIEKVLEEMNQAGEKISQSKNFKEIISKSKSSS